MSRNHSTLRIPALADYDPPGPDGTDEDTLALRAARDADLAAILADDILGEIVTICATLDDLAAAERVITATRYL